MTLATGVAANALLESGDAVAQGQPGPVEPAPAEVVELVPPPSTPWAHGPGETAFDAMPPTQQQGLERADEWKNLHSGHAVHQAWSRYSAAKAAEAAVTAAARAAGTEGLESVGIE